MDTRNSDNNSNKLINLQIKATEKAIEILNRTAPARIAQKHTTKEKHEALIYYLNQRNNILKKSSPFGERWIR